MLELSVEELRLLGLENEICSVFYSLFITVYTNLCSAFAAADLMITQYASFSVGRWERRRRDFHAAFSLLVDV
jgi:hypothetical protein